MDGPVSRRRVDLRPGSGSSSSSSDGEQDDGTDDPVASAPRGAARAVENTPDSSTSSSSGGSSSTSRAPRGARRAVENTPEAAGGSSSGSSSSSSGSSSSSTNASSGRSSSASSTAAPRGATRAVDRSREIETTTEEYRQQQRADERARERRAESARATQRRVVDRTDDVQPTSQEYREQLRSDERRARSAATTSRRAVESTPSGGSSSSSGNGDGGGGGGIVDQTVRTVERTGHEAGQVYNDAEEGAGNVVDGVQNELDKRGEQINTAAENTFTPDSALTTTPLTLAADGYEYVTPWDTRVDEATDQFTSKLATKTIRNLNPATLASGVITLGGVTYDAATNPVRTGESVYNAAASTPETVTTAARLAPETASSVYNYARENPGTFTVEAGSELGALATSALAGGVAVKGVKVAGGAAAAQSGRASSAAARGRSTIQRFARDDRGQVQVPRGRRPEGDSRRSNPGSERGGSSSDRLDTTRADERGEIARQKQQQVEYETSVRYGPERYDRVPGERNRKKTGNEDVPDGYRNPDTESMDRSPSPSTDPSGRPLYEVIEEEGQISNRFEIERQYERVPDTDPRTTSPPPTSTTRRPSATTTGASSTTVVAGATARNDAAQASSFDQRDDARGRSGPTPGVPASRGDQRGGQQQDQRGAQQPDVTLPPRPGDRGDTRGGTRQGPGSRDDGAVENPPVVEPPGTTTRQDEGTQQGTKQPPRTTPQPRPPTSTTPTPSSPSGGPGPGGSPTPGGPGSRDTPTPRRPPFPELGDDPTLVVPDDPLSATLEQRENPIATSRDVLGIGRTKRKERDLFGP